MRGGYRQPPLVMVEGKDDVAFFRHLLRERLDVDVDAYVGDNLRRELRTLSDLAGIGNVRRVVVVHDADDDRESSLKKVWNGLLDAWNADVPQEGNDPVWDARAIVRSLPEDEWVVGPEGREWKVWLVPEAGAGDLERMLWQTTVDEARRGCVEALLKCVGGPERFQSVNKTRLMAYLAVQREPIASIHRLVEQPTAKTGIDLQHAALAWLRRRIADL